MKKVMLLFGAVAILLAACSNEPENLEAQNKIESAKEGETISLRDDEDKGATYTVTAKDLTLVDAKMPNTTIVVGKEIEDADFTLENCVFKSLEVRGGGSNSVHIAGGKIENVIAKKKEVRIVLEKGATVTDLQVELDCTLDADDNEKNAVASISISKEVKEFKIGLKDTDKSISITITNIKSNAGTGEGNVKIVVKDPKIVEGTTFSSNMNDKVVDSSGGKVDIKTDNDDKTDDTDETLDAEGYKKLPLAIQDKFRRFPVDSDSWSDGVTIDPSEDGEVFLITNTNRASENVYDVGMYINMPYSGKKEKSYSIKFDLKADADCYVCVRAEDRFSGYSHPTIWCRLSTEWNTFELHTGKLYEDWTEYTTLTTGMGNASKVEIKNLKIKEDENLFLPADTYYTKTKLIDSVEVTNFKDRIEFTSSISPDQYDPNDSGAVAGIDILFGVLEAGNLYKVTFDVIPDDTGSFIDIWGHARQDEYETAGSSHLSFEKGEKKSITLYIPCYALPYTIFDKDGKELGSGNLEKSIGYIWVSCVDGKEHTIKVENISFSVVERETIETIKTENNLGFYFEGNITVDKVNYEWTNYRDLDNHDCSDDIILMPDYEIYFDYIMSDVDCWNSTKTTTTAFRYGADKSIGNKVDHNGNNKMYYKNEKDYPVALHFGLDDQWRVTVNAEDATGQ